MNRITKSILILAAACGISATAQTHCRAMPAEKPVAVVQIDSADRRADLTRVYCRIIGLPHTSDRIDAVRMHAGKRVLEATDIDGVDFRRYFQWEEEGVITLEIDFPPVDKSVSRLNLIFDTAHGTVKAAL